MRFIILNCTNILRKKKYRVGFISPSGITLYNRVMASTRLRVIDPIMFFDKDKDYLLEIYNPFKIYNIVIFEKSFNDKSYSLAKKLKQLGTKIVFDINVNYFDYYSKIITKKQNSQVRKFITLVDFIFTSTDYIKKQTSKFFPSKKIFVIPEVINNPGIYKKIYRKDYTKEGVDLAYSGYLPKVNDLLLIKKPLHDLSKIYYTRLHIFSNKKVNLDILPNIDVIFHKYNQSKIFSDLSKMDIFIAPRNLKESYNLGHSFTKIGVPMSVGLPIVASPVPSYINSPAILVDGFSKNWSYYLNKLISDNKYYHFKGKEGVLYCDNYYSPVYITKIYKNSFRAILIK